MKIIEEYLYGNKDYVKRTGKTGHHYVRDYEKTDYYCPLCGKQEMWENQAEGDYYVGGATVCIACGTEHYLDHCGGKSKSSIVNQLKTGVTDVPTTELGG